jgi:transcriptional regulator GlxA family with amidase domain
MGLQVIDRSNWAPPGLKAARLLAIKKDVLGNLGEIGLSLTAVAERHGISTRFVSKLFEQEGITFSEFLLSARLEQAHWMLSDPQFNGRTVASIAYTAQSPASPTRPGSAICPISTAHSASITG